jgi:uroporphyrin-III C-methyltransferase/precorrin-2 dehydrogenase/sirohydrochlorin ferrochelatase
VIRAERPLAYMVGLDLAGRRCVVLGGGRVAAMRVPGLLDAGALVTLVAETLEPALRGLAERGAVEWVQRTYRLGDLRGAMLALNTVDDHRLESQVLEEARHSGVLLNTHDRPGACDFAMPALVRRGRLQIATSTSGDSPHVAATVRRRLEGLFGEEWGHQLSLVARVRRRLRHAGVPMAAQRAIYSRLMRAEVRDALRHDPDDEATADIESMVAGGGSPASGRVHLVGAGPGDPRLLTVRARELLLEADVVFHDALVSQEILELVAARARLVDVGKRAGGRRTGQHEINALLIEAARSGHEVVRLKGGDPFLFGRGGEELAALRAAGVEVDVVPGVTAALAAPAAADIPVTFRGVSGSVAVTTGRDSTGEVPDNLERLAVAVDTLVVLMPLHALDGISARLAAVIGFERPAAVIANATTDDQRVVRSTVGDVAAAVDRAGLTGPATLVVGDVVTVLQADAQPAEAAQRA